MTDAPMPGDEVRPVTILFADIVGSTALGERLAPDEVKALVGECVTMMSRAVEEYGGMVQAYAGDGICAYFGVPAAHDDDPERAARTGLRILEVVAEYARDVEAAWGLADFAVRVGINTGQAAVGQVGAAEPGAVALGDATNVAARLQSLAEPGTILVGDATARRLGQRFVFEAAGEFAVKGRSAPVSASRLVGPKARGRVGTTPLVGREEEMAQLMGALGDLVAGRGRVFVLIGEPGIGKTRLLEELRSLVGDRVTWLEGHCLSYGGVPAWPFVDALLGWLGAEIAEPEIALRTKARARLGALFGEELYDVLPSLGRLLRLRVDDSGDSGSADRMRQAYIRWLEALAHEGAGRGRAGGRALGGHPDKGARGGGARPRRARPARAPAHGRDGSRLRRSGAPPARTRRARPPNHGDRARPAAGRSRRAAPRGHPRSGGRRLDPDGPRTGGRGQSAVPGGAGTGPARGRPRAAGAHVDDHRPRGSAPACSREPPRRPHRPPSPGLRGSSLPRPQPSAAPFPVAVLEEVAEGGVAEDLAALLRAEIVREVRRYPVFECSFTHGLLHDAALSTLTPTRKRELYARIARVFEALYAGALDEHLERLAHYHAQAGNLPRAFEYTQRARGGAGSGEC